MSMKNAGIGGIPREVLAAIRGSAISHVYGCGASIFQQGQRTGAVYLIQTGLVKMVHYSSAGGEVITALRAPGWLLGADSAILKLPFAATAVAATECALDSISDIQFLELMRTNHSLSWYMHELQSREITDLTIQELALRMISPRGRFERFLCRFLPSREGSSPIRLEIPLKQQEVAQFLSVTPEHFSRVARQMEREGIILRDQHGVTIFRPEELLRSVHTA